MKRLLRAIWHLGPRLGWRYWRIENKCIANPELVLKWAHECRAAAIRQEDETWWLMLEWSYRLEEQYAAFINYEAVKRDLAKIQARRAQS